MWKAPKNQETVENQGLQGFYIGSKVCYKSVKFVGSGISTVYPQPVDKLSTTCGKVVRTFCVYRNCTYNLYGYMKTVTCVIN